MQDETGGPAQPAEERGETNLLDRLGGEAALNALIGAFYFNVLAHPGLAPFFADRDVARLLSHQRVFFAAILGGEDRYRGRHLREAHRELVEKSGLDRSHFDSLVDVLSFTLDRMGHDQALRSELVGRVERCRVRVFGVIPGFGPGGSIDG